MKPRVLLVCWVLNVMKIMMTDSEIETKILECLFLGRIEAAKELSYEIKDNLLRTKMRRMIFEHECG
jgi:hypothetical protein